MISVFFRSFRLVSHLFSGCQNPPLGSKLKRGLSRFFSNRIVSFRFVSFYPASGFTMICHTWTSCCTPLFYALIFALTGLNVWDANEMKAQAQDWARKMFQEFEHDFGDVLKGEIPEQRFLINNVYQETIVIERAFTSCQCVLVSVSQNTLQSGETAEVVCRFNSPAFDGQRKATVTVRFGRPFVAEVQLNLKGNIIRGVNVSPTSIEFGQVSDSNLPSQQVRISSSGSPSFRIVDVKSTFPHIRVQLKETVRNGGLVSYEMNANLKPEIAGGFNQGELYVEFEENGRLRRLSIPFRAKVVSQLQLPDSITMGPVPVGQTTRKKLVVKGDYEFRLTDVTCTNPAFRIRADDQPRKVHFMELVYSGEDQPGYHESELTFFVNGEQSPAGKLKAYVDVIDSPAGR